MQLCIAIPALNEEATIAQVIHKIPKKFEHIDQIQLVVVNDGSTDRTADIATQSGAMVVNHRRNLGVGAAFHSAVHAALTMHADILVTIDADGQFDPEDIPTMLAPIVKGTADVVTASRFKDKSLTPKMPTAKLYGNMLMAYLISTLTHQKFYDVSCGFRAYSQEALLHLNLFGSFTYTQETFLDLTFQDMIIVEVPVNIRGTREFGQSRIASNLFRYAYQTSKIILKTFRDYHPLTLFWTITASFLVIAFGFGGFIFGHFLRTGTFTPYKWAGFLSGFCAMLSVVFFAIGFILDMFANMRQNQERILYLLKKHNMI